MVLSLFLSLSLSFFSLSLFSLSLFSLSLLSLLSPSHARARALSQVFKSYDVKEKLRALGFTWNTESVCWRIDAMQVHRDFFFLFEKQN